MAPKVSVLLSIFDQPNAFRCALAGFKRQDFQDFELVVCDDGSDEETKAIVDGFRAVAGFPVKHVWQPNKGYRRSKIVNEGFKVSEGGVVLLSDGDCIPHRGFVGVHAAASGPGKFAAGGYLRLSAEYCRTLTPERVEAGEVDKVITAADRRRFRWQHLKNKLNLALGKIRTPKVYGCNISCGRDVYIAVNGYDENFDGIGKEDSDLRNRFRRLGAKPVSLWGKAWTHHVDDVIDEKIRVRRVPRRKDKSYYSRREVPVFCVNGLVK